MYRDSINTCILLCGSNISGGKHWENNSYCKHSQGDRENSKDKGNFPENMAMEVNTITEEENEKKPMQ